MRLSPDDIARLIRACEVYKDKTGSEYLWDVYDHLQDKLRTYDDQYEVADANI